MIIGDTTRCEHIAFLYQKALSGVSATFTKRHINSLHQCVHVISNCVFQVSLQFVLSDRGTHKFNSAVCLFYRTVLSG